MANAKRFIRISISYLAPSHVWPLRPFLFFFANSSSIHRKWDGPLFSQSVSFSFFFLRPFTDNVFGKAPHSHRAFTELLLLVSSHCPHHLPLNRFQVIDDNRPSYPNRAPNCFLGYVSVRRLYLYSEVLDLFPVHWKFVVRDEVINSLPIQKWPRKVATIIGLYKWVV